MIPVVLIHKGASERYPLETVLRQSRKWGNETILLGDEQVGLYGNSAAEFAAHYEHMSGNHQAFEQFCFQRWFILHEWMEKNNVPIAFYQDSDVLLYCNVTEEYPLWGRDYAFTLSKGTSPATSYFTAPGLSCFLDFVRDVYVNHNALYAELRRIYEEMQTQELPGGICDMTLFKFFREQVIHVSVGEMSDIKEGATFDHSINVSDGFTVYKDIKGIVFDVLQRPYGWHGEDRVRFNTLHFQGQAKNLIQEHAR